MNPAPNKNSCLDGICCSVSQCEYNKNLKCYAEKIDVRTVGTPAGKQADCVTYEQNVQQDTYTI